MERGDAGLGRDAYGSPRRERDRRGYGPGPHPSVDGSPPSEYEEDDAVASGRPVGVEEDDYGQLLRRPGRDAAPAAAAPPAGTPASRPARAVPAGWRSSQQRPSERRSGPRRHTRQCHARQCLPGNGMPGSGMPMGLCRTPAPPTPDPRTPDPRTASLHMAASHTAASLMAGRRTVAPCPMAARLTAGRPMAGRHRVGSPGCRTGAGCRRARTASTGLRGPPCRAGHRAGTTGRGRAPRTRTPTAGADRPRRQAGRHRAAPFPEDRQAAPFPEDRQAVPFPEDRLRDRLAGVPQPPHAGPPGYPGNLEYPGLRCCASIRPPDRASMFPTAVSGSARRQNHRGR